MGNISNEINRLRKAGDIDGAETLGKSALAADPSNHFVRGAVSWVYYERIKRLTQKPTGGGKRIAVEARTIKLVENYLRDYARLKPPIPDLAHSQILRQLNSVGRFLPAYLPFLKWAGLNSFRNEDYLQSEFDGKQLSALAASVARETIAWNIRQANVSPENAAWAMLLVETIYSRSPDVLIEFDRARYFRGKGDYSAAKRSIKSVLKQKGNEFWSWSEAASIAKLEGEHQLAIAAFCKACLLSNSDKYLSRVRIELAQLLFERSEIIWATAEIFRIRELYDQNAWRHPPELIRLLGAHSVQEQLAVVKSFDFRTAYKAYEELAQVFLLDDVENVNASFITNDQYGRPIFAFVQNDECSIVVDKAHASCGLAPGSPVVARVGSKDGNIYVISFREREGANLWDCVPEATAALSTSVLQKISPTAARRFRGYLKLDATGFGFVGDVFLNPGLLNGDYCNNDLLHVIARRKIDPKKNSWGWSALAVFVEREP